MNKQLIITKEDIKPSSPEFEVIGAFNPGCIEYGDATLLLIRVAERPIQNDPDHYLVPIYCPESKKMTIKKINRRDQAYDFSDRRVIMNGKQNYLTSISHFRIGRSHDGIHFAIDETPTIMPETIYEAYGIEDPRITKIGDEYVITYSAISGYGINGCMIKTKDFKTFERVGVIFTADNKDICVFPEKIHDHYYALHRPSTSMYGKLDIWLAQSKDLIHWGQHHVLLSRREDAFDNHRLGASAVPFLTPYGWIEIYHSGNVNNQYSLAAILLDKNDPRHVIKRSVRPLMTPEESFEKHGFFGNVVFSCGAIVKDQTVHIYYGASDESVAVATLQLDDLYRHLELIEG